MKIESMHCHVMCACWVFLLWKTEMWVNFSFYLFLSAKEHETAEFFCIVSLGTDVHGLEKLGELLPSHCVAWKH